MPRELLKQQIQDVNGLFCLITDQVDDELLACVDMQKFSTVSTLSVGYDHINAQTCKKKNIQIGNTPDVLTETTAELCCALLFATARRLFEAAYAVKSGEWSTWRPMWMLGTDVSHSTIGIIGMGRIGMACAKMLHYGFCCNVVYWTPTGDKQLEYAKFVPTMQQVLQVADFVMPHCALNEQTKHLCNKEFFAQMKKSAIFINTTRGGLVNQDDLYDALLNGTIRAAGLDVCSPEPLPVNHKLLTLDNCIVLPHIGSATTRTRAQMALLAAKNLVAGVNGEKMPCQVQL